MLFALHIVTFIAWFALMFACYRIQSWGKRFLTEIGTTIVLGMIDGLITAHHQAYTITNGLVPKYGGYGHTSPWWGVGSVVALVIAVAILYIVFGIGAYKYGPQDKEEREVDVLIQTVAGCILLIALVTRRDALTLNHMGPFTEVSQDEVETVLYDITNPDTKGITICPIDEPCVTPADFKKVTDERMFSYSNRYYGNGTQIEKPHDFKSMVDTSIDKQTYDSLIKGQSGEIRVTKVIEIITVRHFQHDWFPFITATTTESQWPQDAPKFHVYHAFTDEIVQKYYVDKYGQVEEIYNEIKRIKQHREGGQP